MNNIFSAAARCARIRVEVRVRERPLVYANRVIARTQVLLAGALAVAPHGCVDILVRLCSKMRLPGT